MAGRGRRRRGAGTVAAVAAVGLIALSGPVTEVAATVTGARTPLPAVPAPAAALPDRVMVVAPPPPAPAVVPPGSVVAIPRPRQIEVAVQPGVPQGVRPELHVPEAPCGGYANPRQIVPGVVPGPGSATVSWQADGHADVRRYRVQAVSQQLVPGRQPEPPVQIAAQPADCEPVNVAFAGLTPGVPYVFWLEEEVPDIFGVLRWVQVGTSDAVVIG
ncbi:hypothetical protein E4P41_17920 [Geodermatophilus sp. DF01-2]|uniref:hypothetical protein n=1 Tax=Geodermatophilus sp. DF01-2 TaxID=2559610 RepID=UPI0010730128|nr:hypothetical protein [Geodermatophilus sp. DF01_2]TFV55036.1 hypothetical protein E4P41_17920 [Geodermatophilus sp. DF01_2]